MKDKAYEGRFLADLVNTAPQTQIIMEMVRCFAVWHVVEKAKGQPVHVLVLHNSVMRSIVLGTMFHQQMITC